MKHTTLKGENVPKLAILPLFILYFLRMNQGNLYFVKYARLAKNIFREQYVILTNSKNLQFSRKSLFKMILNLLFDAQKWSDTQLTLIY